MRYLFAFLVLGSLVGVVFGNPFGSFTKIRASALELLDPPGKEEVLIDSLKSTLPSIELFFAEVQKQLPKNASQQQKDALEKASESFLETKQLLAELEVAEEANRPGIIQSIVKKLLGDTQHIEPTAIPPQCKLQCSTN